jgi:hypothetical protein
MPNCVTYVPGMLCNLCVGKLKFFIVLWHWDKGTVHCPESLGLKSPAWNSWGYGVGTMGLGDWGIWGRWCEVHQTA